MPNLENISRLVIAGSLIIITSFVLELIAVPTPFWSYMPEGSVKWSSGLFTYCRITGWHWQCRSFNCTSTQWGCEKSWKTAQVLEILASLAMLVAVVLVGIKMCLLKGFTALRVTAAIFCFVGALKTSRMFIAFMLFGNAFQTYLFLFLIPFMFNGVAALIGAIVYATVDLVQPNYLHFCFALCISAGIGVVVGAILLLLGE